MSGGNTPGEPKMCRWLSAADPGQQVSATFILRRRQDSSLDSNIEEQLLSGRFEPISRTEAAEKIGADPQDLDAVHSFASHHGLTVIGENPAARTVRVTGAAQQMEKAFQIQLGWFEDAEGRRYLGHDGPLSLPEPLSSIVTAVLGLDQRPIAKHHGPGVGRSARASTAKVPPADGFSSGDESTSTDPDTGG
jgi:kumamolisin